MTLAGNLSFTDTVNRNFLGLFIAILGGFLGHYVAPIFYALTPLAPVLILTAILGWCPIYALLSINHADKR